MPSTKHSKRRDTFDQLAMFLPETKWQPPDSLPSFSQSKYIGIDVETKDENLTSQGPGTFRSLAGREDAYVCGVTLADETGYAIYVPIQHPDTRCLPKHSIVEWLKAQLSDPRQPKIGANLLYDLEWLYWLGVKVEGPCYDVQIAEPLLDENRFSYSLDNLSEKYLGHKKEYTVLKEAVLACGGEKALENPRAYIHKLEARFVGEYAEGDGVYPIQIFLQQQKKLEEEGLWNLFMLETRCIPLLLDMRIRGVPVNIPRAEQTIRDLRRFQREAHAEVNRLSSITVGSVWAADDVAAAFKKVDLTFPWTGGKNPKPSFQAEWLEEHPHPLAKAVLKTRQLDRMAGAFIEDSIIKASINGRVHCQFHQIRGEKAGTVSGRFSSSNPNLQQVPIRNADFSDTVRNLFIPEADCDWHCDDYSQIEPRLQVHCAYLMKQAGAFEAAELYRKDPSTDFHNMTAALTKLERRPAKTIHLGLSYGMGIDALAANLGCSREEAEALKKQYNRYMPFLEGAARRVNKKAAEKGVITTIMGRKARFDRWEPAGYGRQGTPVATEEEAIELYGRPVRRAHTRKAFNRLIQGSAADIMKKAMVDLHESGILKEAPMHLTVHDEVDVSVPKGRTDLGKEIVNIMTNCVKLEVPLKVDCEIGPSWGEIKK